MDKKESMAFLQNCIDMVQAATDEDIDIFRKVYDMDCSIPQVPTEFDFLPPMDKEIRRLTGGPKWDQYCF